LGSRYLTISRPDDRFGFLTVTPTLSATTDAYRLDECECHNIADWFFP
jgi:hypothetical protein